jgi:hypothetical protein
MLIKLKWFFDELRRLEPIFDRKSDIDYGCEHLKALTEFPIEYEPIEFTVYVRKEGKITVPKEVRDALQINNGDLVRCKIVKVRIE